ncbi:MAG: cobalamin-dependent protein [Proteobacteria bacterium]|nr:cobalamin-dependent protein [Pseudomonadota bacterium]
MNIEAGRDELMARLSELNEDRVLALVRQRLERGDEPRTVIEDCQAGMGRVGLLYEQGTYFLSGLIMAGEIFRQVMDLLQPYVQARLTGRASGRVLLGTVQGDIHDIGKNLTLMLLGGHGFTVLDLGVDVPPETFLSEAERTRPDVIGLSGLVTTAYESMRRTVELLRGSNDPRVRNAPVVIGGSLLDDQVAEYVGADHWVSSAMKGVRLCQGLIGGDPAAPAARSSDGNGPNLL